MNVKDSNELCREVVNLLEFEIITMNNTQKNKSNRFLYLVKEVTKKICRMNNLTFKDSDELFLLGQGDA